MRTASQTAAGSLSFGLWLCSICTNVELSSGWAQHSFSLGRITNSRPKCATSRPHVALKAVSTKRIDALSSIKDTLALLIPSTDRGRSASESKRFELETWFQKLESICETSEAARSPLVEGSWLVEYTTAPPPSNGQLGPFKGLSQQVVNLSNGNYQNILRVPPNDWLIATLDARWEEWDGSYLVAADDRQEKEKMDDMTDSISGDVGATCWKVTFQSLSITCFGVRLLRQEFPEDTARVWRTTYVDSNTRLIRAGRTGRRDDEVIFYMTRTE